MMIAELAPGSTVAGVFTLSQTPGHPVVWCRQNLIGGRVRAIVVNSGNANVFTGRAGWQVVAGDRGGSGAAVRLHPQRGVHFLDRRDRRAAAARPHHRGAARRGRKTVGGGLGAGGARDHDDRHVSEGRHRDRDDRRHDCAAQRLREGFRHDRAEHGDDARLHLHRRGDVGQGVAMAAVGARRCRPSTRSRWTATPRPATRCCSARRSRRGMRRSPAPTTRASTISGGRSMR